MMRWIKPDEKTNVWADDPKLHRSRYSSTSAVGLGVYSRPLSFYIDMLDQMESGRQPGSPSWVLREVVSRARTTADPQLACYQYLRSLNNIVFQLHGDAYTSAQILVGLDRATPPRQWGKDELLLDLRSWVGSGKRWAGAHDVRQWVEHWLSDKFDHWQMSMDMIGRKNLSFDEFCSDPTRWATSGGAPKVMWHDEELRSKWAWAMYHLERGADLYTEAMKLPNIAHAALKEEPTKTRLVITTPMSSYLRQAYIMYLFGTPELRSPIYSNNELRLLNGYRYACYASIDARRFDHQIPFWFIRLVMKKLFEAVGQGQLLKHELSHLNRLKVELFGKMIPYHGGVLSGWRLTSLIGTIASQALCEWLNCQGYQCEFVVQGDDILLFSPTEIHQSVVQAVQYFGLDIDVDTSYPTTHGVFLQRAYGGSACMMSAGRALRSLFYASPWVERSQFTTPSSLASVWLQLASRVPGSTARPWILRQAAADMARWARWPGWTTARWLELLTTDSGLGGLGTVDTHVWREYVPTIREVGRYSVVAKSPWHKLYKYFVPGSGLQSARQQQAEYRYWRNDLVKPLKPQMTAPERINWDEGLNRTKLFFDIMNNGIKSVPDELRRSAPHWLRTQPWFRILDWILRPEEITGPQCLGVQQWIINERLQSDISAANRMLHNIRGGVAVRKFSLYYWLLVRIGSLRFALGSW